MKTSPTFNRNAVQTNRDTSIQAKRERVTAKATQQYERCKDSWTAKYYGKMLKQERPAPALTPRGMGQDRTAHLMRAASKLSYQKYANNLQRIDRAAKNMTGQTRESLGR